MDEERGFRTEAARFALPGVILAVGVIGFLALGSRPAVPTRPTRDDSVPLVKTIPVASRDKGLDIEVEGYVVPYREIVLAAEVAGTIQHKAEVCRAGRFVEKDTTLIKIDPKDYDIDLRIRSEEFSQAETNLKEDDTEIQNTKKLPELARKTWDLQRSQLERLAELEKKGQYATDSEVEQQEQSTLTAENAYWTAKNQFELLGSRKLRLTSARDLAKARLEKAQVDLNRTEIKTPIDGVIVREEVQEDDYVNKGTPLVTIEDTSAVEVKCNLRVEELYWLWDQAGGASKEKDRDEFRRDYQIPNADTTVVYQLGGVDYTWKGRLSRYEGIGLDEATRTVPCRVIVHNPRGTTVRGDASEGKAGPPALVRGMFVTVRIHGKPKTPLLQVLERAIQSNRHVWRVRNHRLKQVLVQTVELLDVPILSVRDGGEMRVIDGRHVRVTDGRVVRIIKDEPLTVMDGVETRVIDGRLRRVVDGQVYKVVVGEFGKVEDDKVVPLPPRLKRIDARQLSVFDSGKSKPIDGKVLRVLLGRTYKVLGNELLQVRDGEALKTIDGEIYQVIDGRVHKLLGDERLTVNDAGKKHIIDGEMYRVIDGKVFKQISEQQLKKTGNEVFLEDHGTILVQIDDRVLEVKNGSQMQVIDGHLLRVVDGRVVKTVKDNPVPEVVDDPVFRVLDPQLLRVIDAKTLEMIDKLGLADGNQAYEKKEATPLTEKDLPVIDGKKIRVVDGHVQSRGRSNGEELKAVKEVDDSVSKVIDDGPLRVSDGGTIKIVDGKTIRVVDGQILKITDNGGYVTVDGEPVTAKDSKVIAQMERAAIIFADPTELDARDGVAVTPPPSARDGLLVREEESR